MTINLWRNLKTFSLFGKNLVTGSQQTRTLYVLERVYPAPLSKPGKRPSLRPKHFVFNLVKDDTTDAPKLMSIVLKKYVEDVGQPGDVVKVKEPAARLLLMTNKAAYLSKENVEKYVNPDAQQKTYSSIYAATTVNLLNKFVLNVSMNKEQSWTLEPWHIKAAFRRAKVIVPESAITMPEHTLSGPDMALEGKEFYITVTINGLEKVVVRCRIHHWATTEGDRLPPVRDHWKFPAETIFAEDKEISNSLLEMVPPVFVDDEKSAMKLQRILARKRKM